ncbi:MAG: hypothetical protein ACKO15_13320 [Burkholderiales bacterium]
MATTVYATGATHQIFRLGVTSHDGVTTDGKVKYAATFGRYCIESKL